jgi:hypothetical protein
MCARPLQRSSRPDSRAPDLSLPSSSGLSASCLSARQRYPQICLCFLILRLHAGIVIVGAALLHRGKTNAMMWLPWRNIAQAVAPPVAWSEDEDAQRSALVALDAVGMARFLPRSAALCALGMQVTIEVTSGAPAVAPAAC